MTSLELRRKNQSAHGLAVVLIVMTALAGLVAAAIQYTQGLNRYAHRSRSNVAAQAIGDACLELAFSEWRQVCRNTVSGCTFWCNKVTPPPTNAFASIQLPTQAMFPDVPNFTATRANDKTFTVSNFKVQAVDQKITLTSTDPPVSSLAATAEPAWYAWAGGGWNKFNWYYLASCDVTLPGPSGPVTTKMRRVFEKKASSPFLYFMFFNDDLELNSSSPLTLYGNIHTNAKLYTGTSGLTLNATTPTIYGYGTSYGMNVSGPGNPPSPSRGVTYADDWITGFKSGDTIHTAAAAPPAIISSVPPSREINTQVYDWDPTAWNATDGDTTNDSPHEIVELPPASGTDFMAKSIWSQAFNTNYPAAIQRFSKNAKIRINIAANDVVTIFAKDSSGNEVGPLSATITGPTTDNVYQLAYKQWIAALGVNASGQFLPPRSATNGKTTAGSEKLTVPTAAMNFAPSDLGRVITGVGIPAGTTITGPDTKITATSNNQVMNNTPKTINVVSTASWSTVATGQIRVLSTNGLQVVSYTGKTATTFTGCTGGTGNLATNNAVTSVTEATMSKQATVTSTGSNVTITVGRAIFPTIQDNREGGLIDLVDIDCNMFKDWRPQTAYPTSDVRRNPVDFQASLSGAPGVYIHAEPRAANPGRKRAIRIKNGGVLKQITLDNAYSPAWKIINPVPIVSCFATDNPLYIWGDFNSGRSVSVVGDPLNNASTVPACNKDTATALELTYVYDHNGAANGTYGWTGQQTALIADAVTLLSNAWVDDAAHLSGPLSGRPASNTTVNANIIAGNVPTSATNGYSGGGENFIRLLEDWSGGKRFTFAGSMVQLYQSKTATGKWVPPGSLGNVYNEPTRNWYWMNGNWLTPNTDFYTIAYGRHKWSPAP